MIDRAEHEIRAKAVDGRCGVERVLDHQAERRRDDCQREAETDRGSDECCRQQIGRGVAHDRELERRERAKVGAGLQRPRHRGAELRQLGLVERDGGQPTELLTEPLVLRLDGPTIQCLQACIVIVRGTRQPAEIEEQILAHRGVTPVFASTSRTSSPRFLRRLGPDRQPGWRPSAPGSACRRACLTSRQVGVVQVRKIRMWTERRIILADVVGGLFMLPSPLQLRHGVRGNPEDLPGRAPRPVWEEEKWTETASASAP